MELRLDDTGFGGIHIYQNPQEFCYGVDAVLLADFASQAPSARREDCRIIDLGTGTGIVPLILSHKTRAGKICGVELQENSWKTAEKNRKLNGLEDRLEFIRSDIKELDESLGGSFNIVTSNPPYTAGSCGIESANRAKLIARHETTADLDDFIARAAWLLKDRGDFYMVHRPGRLIDICESCRKHKLEPKELRFVSGKPMEKPNILLVHCVRNGNRQLKLLEPLAVRNADGEYTDEICRIYEKTEEQKSNKKID